MNKYALLFLLAFSTLSFSTTAQALIPLLDPPQAVQAALRGIQNNAKMVTQQANTILAFKTRVINGMAFIQRYANLDNLRNLFENKLSVFANKQLNDVFGGDEFKKLVGNDIAGQFNVNDLAGMNLDKLQNLGIGEVANLTQDQLKDLLGADLASKLTPDQIQSLLNNPGGLLDFFNSNGLTQVQQASATNQGVLNILGTPKDVFKKKAAAATAITPNGNRSDAFGGTGNGSTPQAQAALDAFKSIQANITEKAQIPLGDNAQNIGTTQLKNIRETQVSLVVETALTGLADAWLRQTMRTRAIPIQELEASQKVNSAKDEREAIKSISYTILMGVEAMNSANETFAEDLKVYAAQANQRIGSISAGDSFMPSPTPPATDTPKTPAK